MPGFDWDDENVDHFRQHVITPPEVEEAILDPRRIGIPAYDVRGERRSALLGSTEDGRILFVVFTWRAGSVRAVTARDATPANRRRYRRR